jgi:hypothetical protein
LVHYPWLALGVACTVMCGVLNDGGDADVEEGMRGKASAAWLSNISDLLGMY